MGKESVCSAMGHVRTRLDGMESMSLRRSYVLMRKILSDIRNEGCEGWEENDR